MNFKNYLRLEPCLPQFLQPGLACGGLPCLPLNPAKGGCIPSYHNEKSYIDGLLKTAGRGQEFVCYPRQNKKFKEWLLDLFSEEINKFNNTTKRETRN